MENSDKRSVDRNPTQVKLEDGTYWSPDKDQRFSIAYGKSGKREYQCDDKPVDLQSFVGAMTGKDKIPSGVGMFGGVGEGTMRKAYESEDDFNKRMEK